MPSMNPYDVIVIDPPWPMKLIKRRVRPNQVELAYRTMTLKEIESNIGEQLDEYAADNCHIFLWATNKFLFDALGLVSAWGLAYVCVFVWQKPGGFQPYNMPQFNCEFVVYAAKGSPQFINWPCPLSPTGHATADIMRKYADLFATGFKAPRGRHSEKPEYFYELLRTTTTGRRLDMFNRRKIHGFDGHGDQAGSLPAIPINASLDLRER